MWQGRASLRASSMVAAAALRPTSSQPWRTSAAIVRVRSRRAKRLFACESIINTRPQLAQRASHHLCISVTSARFHWQQQQHQHHHEDAVTCFPMRILDSIWVLLQVLLVRATCYVMKGEKQRRQRGRATKRWLWRAGGQAGARSLERAKRPNERPGRTPGREQHCRRC